MKKFFVGADVSKKNTRLRTLRRKRGEDENHELFENQQ